MDDENYLEAVMTGKYRVNNLGQHRLRYNSLQNRTFDRDDIEEMAKEGGDICELR